MSSTCFENVVAQSFSGGFASLSDPILYVDNASSTQIATNLMFHQCTKYIEIDYHYIREALASQVTPLPYISAALKEVDILTNTMAEQ